MLEPQTLQFLKALKKNNNKTWFDAHRHKYEAARIDFQNFIQLVIDELGKWDPTIAGLTAKDCLFRINRDIRFSNDKTPYKTNFGASIKREGRKSPYAGYYFHVEPGGSFAGGGLWMPEAARLKNLRQEIDYNYEEFNSLLEKPAFKKTFGGLYQHSDISLATAPKGYEKDHPAISYLKLKCFIAEKHLPDEELTKSSLHRNSINTFKTLTPLLQFINRTIGE
jgi:uncharacterized protein (TIGR02453 family)